MFNVLPDDPKISNIDPVHKIWMYENWLADQNDDAELAKNHAYLLASFSHPQEVKDLLGANNYSSTEEEFEETTQLVKQMIQEEEEKEENVTTRRRKRSRRFKD